MDIFPHFSLDMCVVKENRHMVAILNTVSNTEYAERVDFRYTDDTRNGNWTDMLIILTSNHLAMTISSCQVVHLKCIYFLLKNVKNTYRQYQMDYLVMGFSPLL